MAFLKSIKNKFSKKKSQDDVKKVISEEKEQASVQRYSKGLKKSRESLFFKLRKLSSRKFEIDEEYFKELEYILISSDMGATFTIELIKQIKTFVKVKKINDPKKITDFVFEFLYDRYKNNDSSLNLVNDKLNVILVTGVNGVGKTTTIAKLAYHFMNEGKTVALAAGDTFRAGAVEQLSVWADKLGIEITKPAKEGMDPAAIAYQGIDNAIAKNYDVLIIDTAGRLQNKVNLMKQLTKIKTIVDKFSDKATLVERLLILDATTGQNGVLQAEEFNKTIDLTGIILTKMDSSSKGGILLSIKEFFDIPIKFIGLGEHLEDLEEFDIEKYIYGLISDI